jgi:thiol-disulfide isomerase/thioredoxin
MNSLFKKSKHLIGFFIFLSTSLMAQKLQKINLTKSISNYPLTNSLVATTIVDDIAHYIIPSNLNNFIIKKYTFINKHSKIKFSLLNGFDSDYVSILVNLNLDSSKTIIVDTNNDFDFANDKQINYTKSNTISSEFSAIQFMYDGDVVNFNFQTSPYPKNINYMNKNEQEHYLIIKSYESYTGLIKIDDEYHQIYIKSIFPSPYYYLKNLDIALKDAKGNYTFYNPNEVIEIGENKIVIDSISITGDKLFFKMYSRENEFKEYGFSKQFYLKPLELIDFNNKSITIPTSKKYTLIDFWGTWCAPCLELTPKLVALHNKYQSVLDIISIASNSKIKDVENYTKKNKINWTQIVEDDKNKEIFGSKMFAVNTYPTFILIDQNGKIVLRGTGEKALDEAERIIAN